MLRYYKFCWNFVRKTLKTVKNCQQIQNSSNQIILELLSGGILHYPVSGGGAITLLYNVQQLTTQRNLLAPLRSYRLQNRRTNENLLPTLQTHSEAFDHIFRLCAKIENDLLPYLSTVAGVRYISQFTMRVRFITLI